MDLLISLLPSLMFGGMNVLTGYIGGKPRQQNLGLALGAGTLSLCLLPLINHSWSLHTFTLGFLGAVFWSCGQVFLLLAFKYQGVSRSMPVIVGVQLVQNALIGVLLLGEWRSPIAFTLGFTALTMIITGIYSTSWHEKTSVQTGTFNLKKGMTASIISGMFYAIYPAMFQYYKLPTEDVLGPMGISILTCGIIFTVLLRPIDPVPVLNRKLTFLMVPGMMWALGNLALLTSATKLGIATGFTLSQLGVVISTLGGIYILGEKRSQKEKIFVFIGIALVVTGGILLGIAKSYEIN
ncbi:GRP family sugar transporter [Gleimia sp. 6138-11-ORH1]|uniref:GRP family sugar transporter n=1 Tax=Gleimia sp. 6138-11-ORH1 TaxID=2973937 RepID=UPI002166D5DE|nr:GRP family sugar transporter [Gleimia sp. 6138-11-ORH1]MCS4485089.1 GRP family sugar transporter [Gleimia sp. 6138-11-ORH1]